MIYRDGRRRGSSSWKKGMGRALFNKERRACLPPSNAQFFGIAVGISRFGSKRANVTSFSGNSHASQSLLPRPNPCELFSIIFALQSWFFASFLFLRPVILSPQISRGVWPLHNWNRGRFDNLSLLAQLLKLLRHPEAPFKKWTKPSAVPANFSVAKGTNISVPGPNILRPG